MTQRFAGQLKYLERARLECGCVVSVRSRNPARNIDVVFVDRIERCSRWTVCDLSSRRFKGWCLYKTAKVFHPDEFAQALQDSFGD